MSFLITLFKGSPNSELSEDQIKANLKQSVTDAFGKENVKVEQLNITDVENLRESKLGGSNLLKSRMEEIEVPGKWDSCMKVAKWAAIALAVTGLFVGVVGLLVYLGQLELGWTGIGAMTQEVGLYTMMAGFSVTFVSSLLLAVNKACALAESRRQDAEKAETKLLEEGHETEGKPGRCAIWTDWCTGIFKKQDYKIVS